MSNNTNVLDTIETSLSFEYVSGWGVKQGLRELIQNCMDNNGTVSRLDNGLMLMNRNTVLGVQALYMGITTKRDDTTQLGQHGEGMKLALLVLCRENIPVTVHNGSESWIPYFKKNVHNVNVLCFDIEEANHPDSNFYIHVEDSEVSRLEEIYLGFDTKYAKTLDVEQRLTEKKYRGKLFVQGLYVSEIDSDIGYNLTGLTLERDRSVASSFELEMKIQTLWESLVEAKPTLGKLIAKKLYNSEGIEAKSFYYASPAECINKACKDYWDSKHPDEVATAAGHTVISGKSRAVSSAFATGLGPRYFSTYEVLSPQQAWWNAYSAQLSSKAREDLKPLLGI